MQTYMPFRVYRKSAECMPTDMLLTQRNNANDLLVYIMFRLGELKIKRKSRRINLHKSLEKHPVFLMWWNHGKPFAKALFYYLDACNFELFNREQDYIKIDYLRNIVFKSEKVSSGKPHAPKRITTGYRIILLCRDENHFRKIFCRTLKRNREKIDELKKSKDKWRFSKLLRLEVPS